MLLGQDEPIGAVVALHVQLSDTNAVSDELFWTSPHGVGGEAAAAALGRYFTCRA
jgi:hypothetical protein